MLPRKRFLKIIDIKIGQDYDEFVLNDLDIIKSTNKDSCEYILYLFFKGSFTQLADLIKLLNLKFMNRFYHRYRFNDYQCIVNKITMENVKLLNDLIRIKVKANCFKY